MCPVARMTGVDHEVVVLKGEHGARFFCVECDAYLGPLERRSLWRRVKAWWR